MNLEEFKLMLKEKGVVGAGGAGFPSYAKLTQNPDYIILNGAECEPLFSVDKNLITKYAYKILRALEYLVQITGAKQGIIALKEYYKDANCAIDEEIKVFKNLKKHSLENFYPVGDEVVLIHETTSRVVPQGGIPINVGVIVFNIETALNIYNVIENDECVIYKYLTVGGAVKEPKTLKVPIGTKFSDLINEVGGITIKDYEVLVGGPMTGRIGNLNECVTKTTKGFFILPSTNKTIISKQYKSSIATKRAMASCSQCQMCTDLCPRNLLGHSIEPHKIMNAIAFADYNNAKPFVNSLACCQCNICSIYSCHQNLNPSEIINDVKTRIRKSSIKLDQKSSTVSKYREYRKINAKKIASKLGLTQYNINTNLYKLNKNPNKLKLKSNQSIGRGVDFICQKGQFIKKGEIIGIVDEKSLGVNMHCPIDGLVIEVNKEFVIISGENIDE